MERSVEAKETCIVDDLMALMEMNGVDESSEVDIKEEMVVKVMHELWMEINYCNSTHHRCSFSKTPESFQVPECFPGVGGDNERCGPVLSAVGSTVMAGVGTTNGFSGEEVAGGKELKCGCSMKHGGGKMDGYDGGEFDDEWLTSVLSMDPQEFKDLDVDPMIVDAAASG